MWYRFVSVPYWSGQWLQRANPCPQNEGRLFQSPIGRVSGCNGSRESERGTRSSFQSPIGRVSGCNPGLPPAPQTFE